jgi:KAP family P-loop domain
VRRPEQPIRDASSPATETQRAPAQFRRAAFADTPIMGDADDVLGFGLYADALAELIDSPETHTPLTLAISAPWGSGKTSLGKLVEQRLREWPLRRGTSPHVVCWFFAWLHDDAPHLGAALAADVARSIDPYRPFYRRVIRPLPTAMLTPDGRWKRRFRVATIALAVALPSALVPGLRHLLIKHGIHPGAAIGVSLTSLTAIAILVSLVWQRVFAIAQSAWAFIDDPQSEAARGSMTEVRAQLGILVSQVVRQDRRLVIFVDDLERCRPPRSVQVCEVATQLLAQSGVVTVLLADMRAVAAAAAIQYADLEKSYAPGAPTNAAASDARARYGRAYLEKIVQLQFEIPVDARTVRRIVSAEYDE